MLGAKIMQGLMFVLCFLCWDFYLKEWFYSMLVEEGGQPGLAEVAMGYSLVFVSALVLSMVLCRFLGSNESDEAAT